MSQYINEAFKQFRLMEDAEEFPITPEGLDNLGSFMDQAMDDESVVDVIDLEAESEEDLKKSYVGKIICDCNVCHSNIFFNKEDIVIDEDGNVNAEEECPYCMSTDGYTIVGEIKEWSPGVEDEIEDEVSDDELADEPIEIEDEEAEVVEEALKLDGVKALRGTKGLRARADKRGVKSLRAREDKSGVEDLNEARERDEVIDLGGGIPKSARDPMKRAKKLSELTPEERKEFEKQRDELRKEYGPIEYEYVDLGGGLPVDRKKIGESIEDVTINTEDETMTMTTKEDGGVVVETTPKGVEDEFYDDFDMAGADVEEGDEIIAPISDDTADEIMNNEENSEGEDFSDEEFSEEEFTDEEVPEEEAPEEEDVEVGEFDEDIFDELGESYLRRNYNNVKGFKTTQVRVNENLLTIDGVITFKSGNQKKTSFVFESKATKGGKFLFEGYNKQINKGTKAFKMNCSIKDKKIIPESLKYNYTAKNPLQESVKINGVVKSKKRK